MKLKTIEPKLLDAFYGLCLEIHGNNTKHKINLELIDKEEAKVVRKYFKEALVSDDFADYNRIKLDKYTKEYIQYLLNEIKYHREQVSNLYSALEQSVKKDR